MSKKNKSKNRFKADSANNMDSMTSTERAKDISAKEADNDKTNDLKKEFKNLALTILFILTLLAALYYYNLQSHILEQMTNRLFNLF